MLFHLWVPRRTPHIRKKIQQQQQQERIFAENQHATRTKVRTTLLYQKTKEGQRINQIEEENKNMIINRDQLTQLITQITNQSMQDKGHHQCYHTTTDSPSGYYSSSRAPSDRGGYYDDHQRSQRNIGHEGEG